MFDSAARLVLCNRVYIDMYHLRPEHARPGTPLRDLLMQRFRNRLETGQFEDVVNRLASRDISPFEAIETLIGPE